MDPILGAGLASGAMGFIGGLFSNRSNAKEAERNRKFQERMSSTAAQRSVADYKAAGLNPALAYERPASTPGGSQATLEDPTAKAISSGWDAAMRRRELQMAQVQMEKIQAETAESKVRGANGIMQGDLLGKQILQADQALKQSLALQPHMVRSAEIAKIAAELGLSRGRAEDEYWKRVGGWGVAADNLGGLAGTAAGVLGAAGKALLQLKPSGMMASSGKGIAPLFKAPAPRRAGDWERQKDAPPKVKPRPRTDKQFYTQPR